MPIRLRDYEKVQATEELRDVIYNPSPQEVFDQLVPQFIISWLFDNLVQSYAAEHYARMNAMQSATRNADTLLKQLELDLNMARQTQITNEIAEISSSKRCHRGCTIQEKGGGHLWNRGWKKPLFQRSAGLC